MNTGTQKKTKRSGISPLAVLFVALIILFFIGCGAIFFFMEGTNIHQGISGFVRECFMRILLAIVAAVVLVCCVKAILSPERTVKSVLLCLLGCILSIIIPFFMLKSMFLDFPYLTLPSPICKICISIWTPSGTVPPVISWKGMESMERSTLLN